MNKFRKYNIFLIALIFLLLLWINYNTFYNTHYHISDNGCIIFHAHPFHKSTNTKNLPNHTHTKNELIVLNLIYKILFLILVFLIFVVFIINGKNGFFINNIITLESIVSNTVSIRAPPSLI